MTTQSHLKSDGSVRDATDDTTPTVDNSPAPTVDVPQAHVDCAVGIVGADGKLCRILNMVINEDISRVKGREMIEAIVSPYIAAVMIRKGGDTERARNSVHVPRVSPAPTADTPTDVDLCRAGVSLEIRFSAAVDNLEREHAARQAAEKQADEWQYKADLAHRAFQSAESDNLQAMRETDALQGKLDAAVDMLESAGQVDEADYKTTVKEALRILADQEKKA